MEQQLYTAVSSTSSWLDGVENNVFSSSVLLAENAETHLQKQEVLSGPGTVGRLFNPKNNNNFI